jgi:2-keto-4-pentenoate hydratase/2-oxohepta-3-ene-1,7-dioic acid hydratase in catechol pathway
MKIAHARERHAPAGTPFRLHAAIDKAGARWVDLEVARRRAGRADERLAHNSVLFRQPITTLDDHLARGLRVEALAEIVERFEPTDDAADDDAISAAADLSFGPPILRPASLRDFYAFEQHVATMWRRREMPVPEAWYRLPIFYFSNVSEIRGPAEPVWAPDSSVELDYELEIAALIDTPVKDVSAERGEEAIGGYFLMNDWSARDLQRDETTVRLGPAKGKDFATTLGPYLVTPDELAGARAGKGYDLAASVDINGETVSRGNWRDIHFSFGDMVARASADVRLVPTDVLGSGTVGGCCLLEVKDESGFGRYLQTADQVTLHVDRLGELRSLVVERPVR